MARLVGVGLFVLGGLLLFAIGLFMIGDRQMAFDRKFTVYTQFTKITGLQPGALVRVSGARAGTVREIDPPMDPSGKFRVALEITEDLHQLVRTDSLATIDSEGLVGGSFLGVTTGSASAPQAQVLSTIPSREPFELADMMLQMSGTVVKINDAVDVLMGQIQHALDAVVVTVDNANSLITAVSDDVGVIAKSGSRISADLADITDKVRNGNGTVAKLLNDDEMYRHLSAVADHAEAIAGDARRVMQQVRTTLDTMQGKDGGVAGVTDDLRRTLSDARSAMNGFADNMDALKRNFLFRGYFTRRGYFDFDTLSPDEYRRGALTADGSRVPLRIWLRADLLFRAGTETPDPVLTDDGKSRVESALSAFLDRLADGVLVVEGYSRAGLSNDQFRVSRGRAASVRRYLIERFSLEPQTTGMMPLGANAVDEPPQPTWDGEGVAVTLFVAPRESR